MPFATQTIATSKTQEEVKKALGSNFAVDSYQDKLRLELKRAGGNRGFIRILFPKVKTYVKVEEGRAKSSMKLEIIGIVMLIVCTGTAISTATLPEVGGENIPLWAPIAGAVWYLFYSFSSIAKIKKLLTSTI